MQGEKVANAATAADIRHQARLQGMRAYVESPEADAPRLMSPLQFPILGRAGSREAGTTHGEKPKWLENGRKWQRQSARKRPIIHFCKL